MQDVRVYRGCIKYIDAAGVEVLCYTKAYATQGGATGGRNRYVLDYKSYADRVGWTFIDSWNEIPDGWIRI